MLFLPKWLDVWLESDYHKRRVMYLSHCYAEYDWNALNGREWNKWT